MGKFTSYPLDNTPTGDDIILGVDTATGVNKRMTLSNAVSSGLYATQGILINGQISRTVTSNNITVAIKTYGNVDPSPADPVYVRIGNTVRRVTSALSVTKNAGTNWFNSGSAELASFSIDYFVYMGYNATDGVTVGFARFPYARTYASFSTTSTSDRYCAISTTTSAVGGDEYEVVGRFNANLSGSASYNWSVPATNVTINRPIFETRRLSWSPTVVGFVTPTAVATYIIYSQFIEMQLSITGTSNATNLTATLPFQNGAIDLSQFIKATDNTAALTTPALASIGASGSSITFSKDAAGAAWTAAGTKTISTGVLKMNLT